MSNDYRHIAGVYLTLAAIIAFIALLATTVLVAGAFISDCGKTPSAPTNLKLVPNKSQADGARITACGLKLTPASSRNDRCYIKQTDGNWRLELPNLDFGGAL